MTSLQARQTLTPGIARKTSTDHLSCLERWWPRRHHRDPVPDHLSRTLEAGEHTQSPDRPPHPDHSGQEPALAGRLHSLQAGRLHSLQAGRLHSLQHRPTRFHTMGNRRNRTSPGPTGHRPTRARNTDGRDNLETLGLTTPRSLCTQRPRRIPSQSTRTPYDQRNKTPKTIGDAIRRKHVEPRTHIRQETHNGPTPQS